MVVSADLRCFKNCANDDVYRIFNKFSQFAQQELYLLLEADNYHKLRELFPYLGKEYIKFYSTDEEKAQIIKNCGSTTHFDIDSKFLTTYNINGYILKEVFK